MRTLVLSAGYGTRLGVLTTHTPKPMLDVAGHPLLAIILANLRRQGIRDIAVNLHAHAEMITSRLGDGARLGVRLHYARERELLGTLGAAKNLEDYLAQDGPFLLHYGDVVTDQDFSDLAAVHRDRAALATILVHERPGSNSVVTIGQGGRVTGFIERPSAAERAVLQSNWAFSGIAVLDPAVLRAMAPGASDLPRDLLPSLAAEGRLYAAALTGYRCAVDSPSRLVALRADVAAGRCKLFLAAAHGEPVD
jgi:mannose-1-phosphate guanylyltransferase